MTHHLSNEIAFMSYRWFRDAWLTCAQKGWCDELDCVEFGRVYTAYLEANEPFDVVGFIRLTANRPPSEQKGGHHGS